MSKVVEKTVVPKVLHNKAILVLLVLNWNKLPMEAHVGEYHSKREVSFAFEKTSRISLSCKLVPVQYREYEMIYYMTRRMVAYCLDMQ